MNEDDTKYMNIAEVASYLRRSEWTIRQWAQKQRIPAHKVGQRWLFNRVEIDEWVLNS